MIGLGGRVLRRRGHESRLSSYQALVRIRKQLFPLYWILISCQEQKNSRQSLFQAWIQRLIDQQLLEREMGDSSRNPVQAQRLLVPRRGCYFAEVPRHS